jgi:AcrR family transcriptional regulator
MASAAPARSPSLLPDNWLRAAENRLALHGIESVRVEVLARDLGVSKGSFYWHFRDRNELLDKLLARWEDSEIDWLNAEGSAAPASRWANFIARTADADRARLEVALRNWSRADERVASRVAAIEKRKSRLIADILREIGFAHAAAETWSETVQLICLGWLDRSTRESQSENSDRDLGELLSEFLLAASSRSAKD